MKTDFAMDLHLARRKSGLTQSECGFLADIDQSTYSEFERGVTRPTLQQICSLSLLFGRSFDSLYEDIIAEMKLSYKERLRLLPRRRRPHLLAFNRYNSLRTLEQRINANETAYERA